MTATNVNGQQVVSDNPTQAPIRTKDGSIIWWVQTRTLLLANGDVVFGCVHCDYTSLNANSVRPHLGKHRAAKAATPMLGGVSVGDLVQALSDAESVRADRDQWKTRALAAERSLRVLRKALGVTA